MTTIALTLPAGAVTVADGRATLTASVTNLATVPARIVLGAFGTGGSAGGDAAASGAGWTSVERPLREVAAGATEQYAVTFAPPAGTPAGTYPVRFIAYSADQAPEEHADQAKQVDVVVPAINVPPPPPPRPWWPWAVAAALVVVVAVVGWVVWSGNQPPPPGPGPTTSTAPPSTSPPSTSPPSVPLNGTLWRLTAFEDGTPLAPGATFTLTFQAGAISGRACNSFDAPVTVNGTSLGVGSIRSTRMACTGPGVMAQEQRFFATLRAANALAREGAGLTLSAPDGRSLTFTAS